MPGQLSFLTAGVRPPAVDDLEGLLLGVAQVVRLGGTARLSVLVDDPWRVDEVLAAYAERELRGEVLRRTARPPSVRRSAGPCSPSPSAGYAAR